MSSDIGKKAKAPLFSVTHCAPVLSLPRLHADRRLTFQINTGASNADDKTPHVSRELPEETLPYGSFNGGTTPYQAATACRIPNAAKTTMALKAVATRGSESTSSPASHRLTTR